jgi:hypothetical protein
MRARHTLLLAVLLTLTGCAGSSGPSRGVRSTTGPGAGFLTATPAYVRPLRPDVRVTAILTAGDTLFPNDPADLPFVFAGQAGGLGARSQGDGTAEVYVSHESAWLDGVEGSLVSRLVLDLRNSGVQDGKTILAPVRGYMGFAHAALLDSRVGWLRPEFLVNERGHRSRYPLVSAIDALGGTIVDMPWLGAMRHKSAISLPASGGRVVLVMTGGSASLAADQVYMFVANSDTDVLTGRGQMFVLRADRALVPFESRSASELRRGVPVTGTFVPLNGNAVRAPAILDPLVQSAGGLNFVRLEGLAVDRERLNSFYFTDRLGYGQGAIIQSAAGGGRLYHITLDAFDPTRVAELTVVLDAGEGDDIFRPSSIDTDDQCVMIQEYPGARGIHPSRIVRYDTRTKRLEPVADCLERDTRGRPAPSGVGGEWEMSAITNVSDLFGEDSWLFTVQAHTLQVPQDQRRYGEAGQLLLLRGSRNPRNAPRGAQ